MQTRTKKILNEIVWFAIAGLVSFFIGYFVFGVFLGNFAADIHLHDTYIVIYNVFLLTSISIIIIFIIYAIRATKSKFSEAFVNWTMLLSGLTLIIALTFFSMTLFQFSFAEQNLYSPLSQSVTDKFSAFKFNSLFDFAAKILLSIQTLVLIELLYLTYKWGRTKRKLN